MARHCVREPRHVPTPKLIGQQPDLFGGPTVTHEAARKPLPKTWGRRLLAYHLSEHFADVESGQ